MVEDRGVPLCSTRATRLTVDEPGRRTSDPNTCDGEDACTSPGTTCQTWSMSVRYPCALVALVLLVTACSAGGGGGKPSADHVADSPTTTTTDLAVPGEVRPLADYIALERRVVQAGTQQLDLTGPDGRSFGVAVLAFPLAPANPDCVEEVQLALTVLSGNRRQLTAYAAFPPRSLTPANGDRADVAGALLLASRPAAGAMFEAGSVALLDVTDLYRAWTTNNWPASFAAPVAPGTPFTIALRPANVSEQTDVVLASVESGRAPLLSYKTRATCDRSDASGG